MSIVAAIMDPDSGVTMYADRRSITNTGSSTVMSNSFLKVHKISETVVCGITGWAEWGISLISRLSTAHLDSPSNIIEFIKIYPYHCYDENLISTVTLGGIYDNGKPFLWSYRTSGDTTLEQRGIQYTVATKLESLGKACGEYLKERYQETRDPYQTLQSVIEFAAVRDPKYISQEYDVAIIPFRTNSE